VDTVVVTSSGGMQLGTKFVHGALTAEAAPNAAHGRRLHSLCNIDPVDPVDTFFTTRDLDPERTIVVVISKDFGNSNEMLNLRSVRNWPVSNLRRDGADGGADEKHCITESTIMERHVVAVTRVDSNYQHMGISKKNIFRIWDWMIGRFSVCSAVGLLPLSLQFSYEVASEVLNGAHDMDEHFFHAPLYDNIPILLGLLGVWNSTFMGYTNRAILPYSEAFNEFPPLVQLLDMESNGKRVAVDGVELLHPAGEINFGEPGGNSHHPFFQLIHQGRVVPANFIGFMEQSPLPLELPGVKPFRVTTNS
jgi:glucose-6-phosphate isomerase